MHLKDLKTIVRAPTDIRYMYLERQFPGKGQDLFDLIHPFYGWEVKLLPKNTETMVSLEQIVFWEKPKAIRYITLHDEALDGVQRSLSHALEDDLWSLLTEALQRSFENSHDWDFQRQRLWKTLKDQLRNSLGKTDQEEFLLGYEEGFKWRLTNNLWDTFFFPCSFVLAGERHIASKFQPLMQLWLIGNFPIGFDKEDNLLVLVADA